MKMVENYAHKIIIKPLSQAEVLMKASKKQDDMFRIPKFEK